MAGKDGRLQPSKKGSSIMVTGSDQGSRRTKTSGETPACLELLQQPLTSTSQLTDTSWAAAGDVVAGRLAAEDGRAVSSFFGRIISTLQLEVQMGMKPKKRQPLGM